MPDTNGLHALIVEDELLIGIDMQSILSGLGFRSFAFASTAGQAMEQGRLRRPDLVTLDVGLLDGDGLQAARELERTCGHLAMIYVTGHADAVRALEDAVIVQKPFTEGDIVAALGRVGLFGAAPDVVSAA